MKIALTATPTPAPGAPLIWGGPFEEACRLAARLGYDGVEWHIHRPADVDGHALQKLMAGSRLGVPTLGTGMAVGRDGLTFTDPDPDVRRRAVARIGEHIQLAATLGSAVTVGLIWGRIGAGSARSEEALARATDALAECCRLAETEGVVIVFEPLNRYESDYPRTLADGVNLARQIGSANLKLLADTFHMNIEERDIPAALREAGPWLGHVHLADTNRRAPGMGHLDLLPVLRALQDAGYAGYVSFEVLPLPTPDEAAETGIGTVRSALETLIK